MKSFCVTAFGAPLQEIETPTPQPRGREVLLKVKAAGVCHSDLHLSEGGYDLGQGKKLNVTDRGVKLPLTMGHEIAGEVLACGPEATGVKPGDMRLVFPWIGCGECPACRRGTENLCRAPNCIGIHRSGGYAEYVIVPDSKYLIEIGPLSPEQAAPFACSGLTAFGALKKLGLRLTEHPTAIIGAGGVGLMAVILLQAMGGAGAIAIDISPSKREAALKAGAKAALDPKSPSFANEIAAAAPEGLMAAVDFVGSEETSALAINALARGGHYVAVGLYGGQLEYPLPYLPMRALTLQGSYTGSLSELQELMALARTGAAPALPVHSHPMHDVNAVLADLREGRVTGRCVIAPAAS
jgi:propanol-preferring alcohol dehydrogenase